MSQCSICMTNVTRIVTITKWDSGRRRMSQLCVPCATPVIIYLSDAHPHDLCPSMHEGDACMRRLGHVADHVSPDKTWSNESVCGKPGGAGRCYLSAGHDFVCEGEESIR